MIFTHKPDRPGYKLVSKWYFGGVAASGAACITHPLDLLKVHLQTQQTGKISLIPQTIKIVKTQGLLAMYNGLSGSLLRQVTYSTTRFGIYEIGKQHLTKTKKDLNFVEKVGLAAFAGACGGWLGTPGDMVNVRMQNDIKLPLEQRRNYAHALHGLYKVYKEEGLTRIWSGASTATTRAIFVTVGQISFYDQIKTIMIQSGYFGDGMSTHFLASLGAGTIATAITQPLDVLKTRQMNSSGQSLFQLIKYTAELGPAGFFKGFVPAFVRLGPHTILLFLFLEQLRLRGGVYVKEVA